MFRVLLKEGADLAGFKAALRQLVADDVPAEQVFWVTDIKPGLQDRLHLRDAPPVPLPRAVAALIETVVCHKEPIRYALLHQLVRRVLKGERHLLEVPSDELVHRLRLMEKSIGRDLHKMHAFLRFRQVPGGDEERFVAWFEPDHFIIGPAAQFFVDRFRSLNWSILTPVGSAHWDGQKLTFGPPGKKEDAPAGDAFEEGWLGYYESTFNPARVNPRAMRAEMPQKYWKNMPEALAIPGLIRTAPQRVTQMIEQEAQMPAKRTPTRALEAMSDQEPKSLAELNAIIAKAGPLVPGATQAVFGEGPEHARLVFVGEQPGDQEDLAGRPFVGPAGQLLSRAMDEVGLDRGKAYLTNAVKHFKFEQRGKRRIHMKPTAGEVSHYRPWLQKELDLVGPRLVVALGATAVLALAGKALPITKARGETRFGQRLGYITVHPSYLLRLPDEGGRQEAYEAFVADLARIRDLSLGRNDIGGPPLAAE
jgi:uracil-DNA glycosylase